MTAAETFDIENIRKDFPIFREYPKLVYLDNAATSQKPADVIRAQTRFYEKGNANPMRGLYDLAQGATVQYEEARRTIRDFICAESEEEIIFTRNATEGLNLAAYSLGNLLLKPGDEILVSIMEHHSNLIPWQQAAARTGAALRFLECETDGVLTEEAVRAAVNEHTRIVAVTQMSNLFGRINDIRRIAEICHEQNAALVVDGAQSVPHIPVDVQRLDIDFLAFSGHKLLAPMGIGVLYGKKKYLSEMEPFLCGGEMISSVSRKGAVFAPLPHKFEAGTVNAAGAVALAEAVRYIKRIGFDAIERRERHLTELAFRKLREIPAVHILGSEDPACHHGILTFTLEGVHPHDVATILASDGIAVRAGHHCAQPLHQFLKIGSTTRASLAFYNTEEDILKFADSLAQVRRKMGYAE